MKYYITDDPDDASIAKVCLIALKYYWLIIHLLSFYFKGTVEKSRRKHR